MSATDTRRQEIIVLTDEHKNRILDQIRHRKETCPHCGGKHFSVGDALYLGFLFRSEDSDAYMVGLTSTPSWEQHPSRLAGHVGVPVSWHPHTLFPTGFAERTRSRSS
jgi:hypothetical protein